MCALVVGREGEGGGQVVGGYGVVVVDVFEYGGGGGEEGGGWVVGGAAGGVDVELERVGHFRLRDWYLLGGGVVRRCSEQVEGD